MKIKYPRTVHLPWSSGATNDDKVIKDMSVLRQCSEVVVTEKMDGENTTAYNNGFHARSLDSASHTSRDYVKAFLSCALINLPDGWRVCGENVFARHSIQYDSLEHYFLGFSIWDDQNVCKSWEETLEWFDLLGITPVKTLYCGEYDENLIKNLFKDSDSFKMEGYVVRDAGEIKYKDFQSKVAKFVRKGHVQTDKHWMHSEVIKNTLI